MAKPETPEDIAGSALVSIAETDAEGRYRLDDIPPGAYYILAGRVDLPTYYPGTSELAQGQMVNVTPGTVLAGFDFTMTNGSVRTAFTDVFRAAVGTVSVSLQVVSEGKLPFSSDAGAVTLQFERLADGTITNVPVTSTSVNLQYVLAASFTDFRVSVANLPDGYSVNSITQDAGELPGGVLKVPSRPPAVALPSLGTLLGMSSVPVSPIVFALSSPRQPGHSPGVRVTGLGRASDTHPIYLSGRQGMTFTDGTFEFRDVPPGRHTLALVDTPGRTMGATLVVGNNDIHNVQLEDVPILPADIQSPKEPQPAGSLAAGSLLAPVTLRGRVLEETTKQPPSSGQVYIGGRYRSSYALDNEGRFEISGLLPGTYTVEIQVFGYSNVNRQISVGTEDLSVELLSRKLY